MPAVPGRCRQFEVNLKAWRLRFVLLDLFFGLAWMFNLVQPIGVIEGTGTFMLFVMLLVVAVSSMLAFSLPIAVFASTVPVTGAVAINFALQGQPALLHPRHHGGDRAGLFPAAGASPLFVGLADAAGARREGHADRRTGTGQDHFRRGASPRRSRQHLEVALPRADEPRIAHPAQRHSRLLRSDEERDFRHAFGRRPTRNIPTTFTIPASICSA